MPAQPPLRILFVAGCSRSGSTLLGRLLDQIDGFFDAGELHHLWKHCFAEGHLCGCGRRFSACPLWTDVLDGVFGGHDAVDVGRMRQLRSLAFRPWRKWAPLRPLFSTGAHRRALDSYAALVERLLDGIRRVTGAGVVVDSSKNPLQARILAHIDRAELHVVHLVRDSRAVAFSHQRTRALPSDADRRDYQLRMGPVGSCRQWLRENAGAESLRTLAASYLRLRYEDLAGEPLAALRRVVEPLGIGPQAVEFVDAAGTARLNVGHCPYGNPMRMRSGPIQIRLDDEWRRRLSRRDRWLVTALTGRRLRRYGYLRGPVSGGRTEA